MSNEQILELARKTYNSGACKPAVGHMFDSESKTACLVGAARIGMGKDPQEPFTFYKNIYFVSGMTDGFDGISKFDRHAEHPGYHDGYELGLKARAEFIDLQ